MSNSAVIWEVIILTRVKHQSPKHYQAESDAVRKVKLVYKVQMQIAHTTMMQGTQTLERGVDDT